MPRFHFTLLHLADADNLEVSLHGNKFPLTAHTADSHRLARQSHAVLSKVSEEKLRGYSHYAEIKDHHLKGEAPRWLQVVRPMQPGSHLQEVVLMSQIIPPSRLYAFYLSPMWKERHARRYGRHINPVLQAMAVAQPVHSHGRLTSLGVTHDPGAGDRSVDLLMGLQELVDTDSTAAGLIAHHPDLATTQIGTAAYIRDFHILPDAAIDPDQYNAMVALSVEIRKTPAWSPVVNCTDQYGDLIKADYDLGLPNKPPVFKTGQQMQTFGVAGNVLSFTAPATSGARRTSSDDLQLQNQTWSSTPGTSALRSANGLKTTKIGFKQRPGIAYALSTNDKNSIDQTNFILDPQNGVLNLRKITLGAGTGDDFGLGDPNLLSWGSFPSDNLDAMAIHPSNAVLACSFNKHKLMILQLPETGLPDGQAPEAVMVSGKGVREGLMKGPKALVVAPDGRILVLESLNNRVQAFDILGNAVPCFTPNPWIFQLPTANLAAALDAGQAPDLFIDGLVAAGENYVGPLTDSSYIAELDGGKFQPENDPLILAFSKLLINLAFDKNQMDAPLQSVQIQVVQAGQNWIITDPRQQAWQILHQSGLLNVYKRSVLPTVKVQEPGSKWLLTDHLLGSSWMLEVSSGHPDQVEVFDCFSYFALQTAPNGANLHYLDMAVEAQGYMYVLSYQNDGTAATDYLLDVYDPDGTFLFRSPDASKTTNPQNMVAGRIAVDIWRDLYALTYETLSGPNAAIQPGLAHWMPTPPLFSFPLTEQPNFNAQNISAIAADFKEHKITLSSQAFILVENPDGYWQVKDGTTIYHVYRSGDALQVYSVPA